MQFRDKTAYVWGLRYRWDPLLSRNPVPRFPHFMPPWVIVIIMMMIIEMKHRGGRVKLAHIIVSSTSTVENLLWHFLLNLGSAFCLQIWSPWKSLVVLKITLHKDSRLRWQFRRAKHRCRPEAQWSPCSHLFIFSIITTFIVDMKTNVMILQILHDAYGNDEALMTIPVPPHLRGLGTQLTRCWGLSSIRSWVLKMDQFNKISTYF